MRGQLSFTVCLIILAGVFLLRSTELGAVARMVPAAVLLPTVCLLLVQLVLDIRARVSRVNSTQRSYSVIRYERSSQQSGSGLKQERELVDSARPVQEYRVVALLFGLLLVIYLLGALGGGCLFLVVYLRYVARSGWLAAIGASVIAVGLSTVCLEILEVNLPPARLLLWLSS